MKETNFAFQTRRQRLRQDQISAGSQEHPDSKPWSCFFWPGLRFLEGPALLSCVTEGVGQAAEGLVCAPLGGRREPLLSRGRLASQMVLLGAGRPVWRPVWSPVSTEGSLLLPVEDSKPSSPQMGLYALAQPQEGEAMFPALSGLLSGLTRPSERQRSQVLAQLKYDVRGGLALDTVTQAWLQTWPFGCHRVTLGRSGNLPKLQNGEGPLPFFLSTSLCGGSVTWTEGLLPAQQPPPRAWEHCSCLLCTSATPTRSTWGG